MVLSKPSEIIADLSLKYLTALYSNPVRTKSITSCVVAASGNLCSQWCCGVKTFNLDSVYSYGIYGLLFGGWIPHYFYLFLDKLASKKTTRGIILKVLFERFIYVPIHQAFSLYVLGRLEGKSHDEAVRSMKKVYFEIVSANWRWLTFFQLVNLSVIPPALRVLFSNIVGFFWCIYLSNRRLKAQTSRR